MATKPPANDPASARDHLIDTLASISGTLRYMAACGCRGVECSQEQLHAIGDLDRLSEASTPDLETLQAEVSACVRCDLSRTRSLTVFGEGDSCARLVFVGEGPGFEEDRQGRPFVGAAGQLLTKIIQAMGLTRDDVYICNIIKCRPPDNRNPLPEEIEACLPYLERQLRLIQPEYICALGAVAARTLLKTETPISRLRGRLHTIGEIRVMPTYHPAYLLRNPDQKRAVWQDMQVVMREMGLQRPSKTRETETGAAEAGAAED